MLTSVREIVKDGKYNYEFMMHRNGISCIINKRRCLDSETTIAIGRFCCLRTDAEKQAHIRTKVIIFNSVIISIY